MALFDAMPRSDSLEALARGVRAGDTRALGRAISACERGDAAGRELLATIYGDTGRAAVAGITGSPGAGKSTLVAALARHYRASGETIAIVAVDPSSSFTGGALLGDRIRMQALYTDPGVFIRSMATRGTLGGLARATLDAIDVLDAGGFARILVETVGVGQDEVEVASAAETTVVVLVPGMGDDIQAGKAGVMEIGDIFVVNKADRDGAARTVAEVRMMLHMGEGERAWTPPVLQTVASRGEGLVELAVHIDEHRRHLAASGEGEVRRRERADRRLAAILREALLARLREGARAQSWEELVEQVAERRIDPYRAAAALAGDAPVQSARS